MRVSPSGKAQASQACIRGFESRHPLHIFSEAISMKFKALIFDLDGTLLNTLADMVVVTNKALASVGYPERTEQDILSYIGNGGLRLVQQAVPEDASPSIVDHVYETWKMLYAAYGDQQTKVYPGMAQALEGLKAAGVKLGVLSNKNDRLVHMLIEKHLPGYFDVVHGERKGVPRKPDPAGLLACIEELGLNKDEVAYVGDSQPDVLAASSGGVYLIGVSWGFGGSEFRADPHIDTLIQSPKELLDLV